MSLYYHAEPLVLGIPFEEEKKNNQKSEINNRKQKNEWILNCASVFNKSTVCYNRFPIKLINEISGKKSQLHFADKYRSRR